MNRLLLLLAIIMCANLTVVAQQKNFSYKFYGQVRGDLFYNSRANSEIVDGLFHLYPADIKPDADGNDLNARPNGSFYLLYSRLGFDVNGPKIGSAASSAKIEIDFRGSGSSWTLVRIRHAYVNLDWGKQALLIGQTWHPLFGDVFPQMLNLSTGAPFQPFNRSPQIRYRYNTPGNIRLTAAAIWQLQYLSTGPIGKSEDYIKNSCVPEFYVSAEYQKDKLLYGAGLEILSLKPRTESVVDNKTYKVNERITTLSAEAHVKYTYKDWFFAAKTMLASNLTQTCTVGGYAVSSTDARTGKQDYTPFRHSMTWVNAVYGKKWKAGIFAGYLKNLGTSDEITGTMYGTGLDVAQVFTTNLQISYNLPHWKVGFEYSPSTAWYGDITPEDGMVRNTHAVTNHRFVGGLTYSF